MSTSQSTSFECPHCAAKYELVRVEAPQGLTIDREITCLSCGGPLHGRDGPFFLKYFSFKVFSSRTSKTSGCWSSLNTHQRQTSAKQEGKHRTELRSPRFTSTVHAYWIHSA